MATQIYNSEMIYTVDGDAVYLTPLKIKYLRIFMKEFENVKTAIDDGDAFSFVSKCALIAMMQYKPEIKTIEQIEDTFDIVSLYKVLEIAAGITLKAPEETDEPISQQASSGENTSWETMDLAKLESEVFLLGIWKDYEELESSLSMPELSETLNAKREESYNDRKFLAALKGIDIDGGGSKREEENAWEKLKNKVFNKGGDPNDVTSLRGRKAVEAGFGIGMGLTYEKL
jgi:hypothetical protein